jgi:hypothetical protein
MNKMETLIRSNVKINFIQMSGALLAEVWILNSAREGLKLCEEMMVYMN